MKPFRLMKEVLIVLALIACGSLVTGCAPNAGQTARESLLSPAAQAAWPMVKANAWYGIDAKVAGGELNEDTADFQRETVVLFDEAITKLGGSQ